ncbi:MAG TPA: ABC transporter ATP-binding protein [Candidatus Agrococcus pullicola]|uniref:ABC transporter ATP-binding protein n=1 Tax=Candidatus Agrococcus pullicola TaxID=2838429 RepID=A0A9D1YW19_9MICO|nr:ABC transporter ATP-binding protein [Candidatus Agrococcus pullicola]
MPSAIRVENVTKTFRIYHDRNQSLKGTILQGRRAAYEDFQAVDDVSFEVEKGTTFGLMGRNGSGKSTLLKCVAGILEPNRGSIVTDGRLAAMLEVGSGFHPELSGRENIYLNAAIIGMSKREVDAKFDEIVEFSGVERFIDNAVKNYSSGMYVRLGFSVAIHTRPDILVVDEIFSVGDADFQAKSRQKFHDLKESGTTIMLVSHSVGLMKTFCDQVAWLDHGKLMRVGEAEDIIPEFQASFASRQERAVAPRTVGLGGATFDGVEVLNSLGETVDIVSPEEPVRIRLRYTARERIERPVFTLSMANERKQTVFRVNGADRGWIPDAVDAGEHVIDVVAERLPLTEGMYWFNADVRSEGAQEPQANVTRLGALRVDRNEFWTDRSLVQVPWSFEMQQ